MEKSERPPEEEETACLACKPDGSCTGHKMPPPVPPQDVLGDFLPSRHNGTRYDPDWIDPDHRD